MNGLGKGRGLSMMMNSGKNIFLIISFMKNLSWIIVPLSRQEMN
jgi:hypothetical protein